MLPWGRMLQAGLRAGVAPGAFWALSLREWRALMAPQAQRGEAMSRGSLSALMAAYPDTKETDDDRERV